jgi:uncharacterized protein (TIGR02996 family)
MAVSDETEAGFWAAIAAAPEDDLPKLVFADWLDERGDVRGACLRWIVNDHKQPAFDRIDTKTWDWWSRRPGDPTHYELSPSQYVLPLNLFTRIRVDTAPERDEPNYWRGVSTYLGALQALCTAWHGCIRERVDPLGDDSPRGETKTSIGA